MSQTRPPAGSPGRKNREDFAQVAERYLAQLARDGGGRRPTTLARYRAHLERDLIPFFDGPLAEIDAARVGAYVRARQAASRTTAIHAQLRVLHGLFAFAIAQGWAAANPVAARVVCQTRLEPGAERQLTRRQLAALIAAVADDAPGRADRTLYATTPRTKLGLGELLALRWSDVDFDARLIRVERCVVFGACTTPKRGERVVRLDRTAARQLAAHRARTAFAAPQDLVFGDPITGAVQHPDRVRRRLRRAAARAGLPASVRFHHLRHGLRRGPIRALAERLRLLVGRWS